MSKNKKIGICAYCACEKQVTREHVIPNSLFEGVECKTRILVPACEECNNHRKSQWDENFRNYCCLAMRPDHPRFEHLGDSFHRSLEYAAKKGKFDRAKALLARTELCHLFDIADNYLGVWPIFNPNHPWLMNYVSLVVQGLNFHATKVCLPSEWVVKTIGCWDVPSPILDKLRTNSPVRKHELCDVFVAHVFDVQGGAGSSLYVTRFLDTDSLTFFSLVGPSHIQQKDDPPAQ